MEKTQDNMTMNDPEFRDAVRMVWDISSSTYDRIPGHRIGTPEEKSAWRRELSRVLPPAPARVLDVGCGTGAMGLVLAGSGYHVAGIDLSREMIARVREKADEDGVAIDLIAGDAQHLPFDEGTFDAVVTRHLVWTIPDPVTALGEWYRVLVPGGRVIIVDGVWNDGALGTRIKTGFASLMSRTFSPETMHPASYNSDVRDRLPHGRGVPGAAMLDYISLSGFVDAKSEDLMYIRKLQKSQIPWYQRPAQGRNYYLISAVKPLPCVP